MNKNILLALVFGMTALCAYSAPVNSLPQVNVDETQKAVVTSSLDKNTVYYPNATVSSAIAKYKAGNYIGCLQELFSVTKKDPSNAVAYYYMAMAYSYAGMSADAIEAYDMVMSLTSNEALRNYAAKGKDCLTNGPLCSSGTVGEQDALDRFVNAPYGDGISPELNQKMKQQQLKKFQQTINKKENLENKDIEKLKEFDDKNSMEEETIKIAQVSDEEILKAVNTLKEAGLNVTVGAQENPYAYQDPRMMEMSMMLGNNNNNNNNNMMNMLPFLMKQAENGENIDPRLMQTIMTSSMLSDLNFNSNNNNY